MDGRPSPAMTTGSRQSDRHLFRTGHLTRRTIEDHGEWTKHAVALSLLLNPGQLRLEIERVAAGV
jgi:hypothetical protein